MRWTWAMIVVALACCPNVGWGQGASSSSSSSGMFGSRSMGSGITAGQSSFMGSSSGKSSLSSQSAFGQKSTGSVGGQARQAGDFVGGSNAQQAKKGFVGNSQAGANAQGAANSPQSANQRQPNQGKAGNQGAANTPTIRTVMTVGFEPTVTAPSKVGSAIGERLMALPSLHWRTPVQIELQGRTAILRGEVATQRDRDLAVRVVRLEPAVDQVQNQIVVVGPGPKKSEKPTPPGGAPGSSAVEGSAREPAAPAKEPPTENPAK